MKNYNSSKTIRRNYTAKHRTRIKNKLRFTLFCTVCIAAAVSLFSMFSTATASKYRDTFTLTVSTGDTLWDIAVENNPKKKDVREVVDDIVRLNHMTSSSLSAGDEIIIPVY